MNCGGFYVSADFLYWRAENHGYSYAFEITVPDEVVGDVIRVHPGWDPGFRVGLGWNTTYDFWDLFLNYTWYRNQASEERTSELGFLGLWPVSNVLPIAGPAGEFGTVSASTHFTLNMGDFELGRLIYLTKTVAIRPHWGVRGGTIHQKFKNTFSDRLIDEDEELVTGTLVDETTFSAKNDYWGVGPRTGVHGEWHLCSGFSILGKVAGALLYGETKMNSTGHILPIDATELELDFIDAENFYQLVPNLQLLLGLQWQTCFWCEKMFFKVNLAWETNYWWDQFNVPASLAGFVPPLPTIGNQPLTMEGLTLNVEWDF